MTDENHHHHHLFHHKEKEPRDPEDEVKHHKHLELLGKTGVVADSAYALHEKHMAKKELEKAHQHKIAGGIVATVALGAAGFAFHEHHEKKDAKHRLKD